jgi:DNA ligase (NAD+)
MRILRRQDESARYRATCLECFFHWLLRGIAINSWGLLPDRRTLIMVDVKKRAEQLRDEIRHHDRLYYQLNKPDISDQQYDALFRELVELERQHPELAAPDSPTQRVGGKPLTGFESVTHTIPMISIDNTYNEAEVAAFDTRVRKTLGAESPLYICEPKIDGVSLALRYENGVLVRAATRGDGERGDDVTTNARTIRDIPLKLQSPMATETDPRGTSWPMPHPVPPVVEVRGEVYLSRQQFAAINQQQDELGLEAYANPRNTAAGSLKLLDPREAARRRLKFIPHGLGVVEGFAFISYRQWMAFLRAAGFAVSQLLKPAQSLNEIYDYLHTFDAIRHSLPYDTDGVVIKVDSFAQRELLGSTARAPRWCIAYKYQPEQAESELARVVFQVGKTGTITPVAEFDPPVFISGTNVYRASLHNFDEIRRKDIQLHDRVMVQKAGEVIPYVVGPVKGKRPPHAAVITPPALCPSCHGPAMLDGGFVRCTNPICPAQLVERIRFFGGRDQMDINHLGPAIIEQLTETGALRSIPDLYRLQKQQLMALPRMGEKSADNLLAGIAESKGRGLSRLLAGLGVLHVGINTAEDIAAAFPTRRALVNASLEDFQHVPGVGDVVSQSLHRFLHQQGGDKLLEELESLGVSTQAERKLPSAGGALAGKLIVVTGTLEKYTRAEIKAVIEQHGGKLSETVKKGVDFLVVGTDAGSKLEKAQKLGIPILDEATFKAMI